MGALNIKDHAVAEKARRLARLKGTTITEAVSAALEESLRAAEGLTAAEREARERRVDEIVARFQASIPPDSEVWKAMDDMYDEDGLPK